MPVAQPCWIFIFQAMVSRTRFSLRVLPHAVSDTATDGYNAKNESSNINTVSQLIVRCVFREVDEGSDECSAIREGDLEAGCRCSNKMRSGIV